MGKSTKSRQSNKPAKPHKDFPLFACGNGQWAKKVRGHRRYFGAWDDPDAALRKWLDSKDDLLAGRTPRKKAGELTVKGLADRFLTAKNNRMAAGELNPRSYQDYVEICQRVADVFGKHRAVADLTAEDFERLRNSFGRTHGPARLSKDVTVVKMLFRWGHQSGLCNLPLFGPEFRPPSTVAKKRAGRKDGRKDFTAEEMSRLLCKASGPMRCWILLAFNAALGQNDLAELRLQHVDLSAGWLDFPRPKTEAPRRCPLWPETVRAFRETLSARPEAKDSADADRVFLTPGGRPRVRITAASRTDSIGAAFNRLMESIGINGRRGFYGLRHTFETQAGESRDQVAVDRIMGHADNSMAANYRHHISDERLRDVVNVVRNWLWPEKASGSSN